MRILRALQFILLLSVAGYTDNGKDVYSDFDMQGTSIKYINNFYPDELWSLYLNAGYLYLDNYNHPTITNETANTETLNVTNTLSIPALSIYSATTANLIIPSVTNGYFIKKDSSNNIVPAAIVEDETSVIINRLLYQTSLGSSTFFGDDAGRLDDYTSNYNSGFGYQSSYSNRTGTLSSGFGYQSLYTSSANSQGTALGYKSLYSCNSSSFSYGVAFGSLSCVSATIGSRAAVGYNTIPKIIDYVGSVVLGSNSFYNSTSAANTGSGYNSGYDCTSGGYNLFLGYNTGRGITTGTYNTIIGSQITGLSSSTSNTILISDGEGNIRIQANATRALIPNGVSIGTTDTATANMIDDASNGSSSTDLYVGNKKITSAFTLFHYYPVREGENLQAGELCSLVDGCLVRTTQPNDANAIGIYQGVTNDKDSFDRKVQSYSVACSGDSYEESLQGARVIVDGTDSIKPGDLLCSAEVPGYLKKQPESWVIEDVVNGEAIYWQEQQIEGWTVGKAVATIQETTKNAYIYICK